MKKLTILMFCLVLLIATFFAGCASKDAEWDQSTGDTAADATTDDVAEDTADASDDSADISPLDGEAAYAKDEPEDNPSDSGHYYEEQEENTSDEGLYFGDDNNDYNYPSNTPGNNEEYGEYTENPFLSPYEAPLSTFSIDVDTASYSNIRRYLENGELVPTDAVRVEECINYFDYDYDINEIGPIGTGVTISDCPWNDGTYLARVAVRADELDLSETPDSNIVFLIDVSGSMNDADKLPLVKSALTMLSGSLREDDRISIVVYAGASGVVLDGCSGDNTRKIERALASLSAGGSTAGGAGIDLAYDLAEYYFIKNGNNRVILCTDGDFNVGPSTQSELEDLIASKRRSGVFLSVLGFGEGNIKDTTMETLADKGNGNYAYIDSLMEAKKVLVNELTSTLYTVAKDVKIQVEFNPAAIEAYRLVGYDNRRLNAQDFNDDRKDAGEMGAGHTVTVFYEIALKGSGAIDDLVFQDNDNSDNAEPASDWMYVKTRYKLPDENESRLMTLMAGEYDFTSYPDDDFRFASAVAEFALILKNSQYKGDASFSSLIERARSSRGEDNDGYRSQFLQLAELAYAMYK